jgi:polyhydroxyalkanoate synthesis repressor PhaR
MTIRHLKSVSEYQEGEQAVTQEGEQASEPVIIKKYANRRLYNTESSAYVTLDALAEMVRSERDFVVYDAKSGEDLTHSVLTQIIVEQESSGGQNLLPIGFLRQLIRFYGNSMEGLVPSYLEFSLDTLTREQEKYQKQFTNAFGHATFEAMQEQARRNIALFEHALTMFSPFAAIAEGRKAPPAPAAESSEKNQRPEPTAPAAGAAATRSDELAQLRQQLAAMQEQINKLSARAE